MRFGFGWSGLAASDAVQRLAEVQLSYTKDFAVLHTLSSQPQIGCSVGLPGREGDFCRGALLPYRLSLFHAGCCRLCT